jgi:hypothetical protein
VFRGGGGFGRLPMTDDPLQLLIAVLVFALLIWLAWRLITS